jgi:hypothetical protein
VTLSTLEGVLGRNKTRAREQPEPVVPRDPLETRVVRSGSKGRPTPRRREAEQRNRRPVVGAPRLSPNATKEERKAARKAQRQAMNTERAKAREAMFSGDEKYLPEQHRGPARRWARDYVDARRNPGEYLLVVAAVIFALGLIPGLQRVAALGILLLYAVVLVIGVDAYLLSRRVRRAATQRFGDRASAGIGWYAARRSLSLRRARLPRPQVNRGEYPT